MTDRFGDGRPLPTWLGELHFNLNLIEQLIDTKFRRPNGGYLKTLSCEYGVTHITLPE